MNTVFGKTT